MGAITMTVFSSIKQSALAAISAALIMSSPTMAQDIWENAWLDDTYSEQALKWAETRTNQTLQTLQKSPVFKTYLQEAESLLKQGNAIPNVRFSRENAFNYAQSEANPLGLWQHTKREAYFSSNPSWETLIDFDILSREENKKWLFAGANCNADRCLVSLSDNGKDAHEIREFDLINKTFIANGFHIPFDKASASWYDADTLLVASTKEGGRANDAGLPATLRLWKRGTKLSEAHTLFEINNEDAFLFSMLAHAGGMDGFVAVRRPSFFESEYSYVGLDGTRVPLPLPRKAQVMGSFGGGLLLRLNQDWQPTASDAPLPSGALVSISLNALMQKHTIEDVALLYMPIDVETVRGTATIGNTLYIELLRNYRSVIIALTKADEKWSAETLPLPNDHFISLLGTEGDQLSLKIEAPLSPPRLSLFDPKDNSETVLYNAPAAFDASNLVATLLHTNSKDGTPLSYTIIHAKDMMLDGKNPTLVYGYGGFDVAITPRYEPIFGKLWLEKGGIYVHAYIRGGGERGPNWHQTAMLKNRQKPYDDMAAIIKDLHSRDITSPKHTGIMGRSNGGLMVAAVMTQQPDLLNAVIVGGPLIDMLTYHKLGPGGTWTAEYGDPRDSQDIANFIKSYSPLQQLRKNKRYPTPLIITSVDDDRVLPGHARRLQAKLEQQNHDALYFEDKQGGHYWELAGGPAPGDWRLRAVARAAEFTYLLQQLKR